MIKLGLRGRLVTTYLVLGVLGVGGLVFRFGLLEQNRIIEETEHNLEAEAFILEGFLEEPLHDFGEEGDEGEDDGFAGSFQQRLDGQTTTAIGNLASRITILTLRGEPIYDNRFSPASVGNQLNQPEVQSALQGFERHDIRIDPATGEERLYAAAVVSHEDHRLGVVQLSIPTVEMRARISQTWLILLGTALVIVLSVIVASLWLANYILQPIKTLQQAATRIAGGDLDHRLEITGSDELGHLAELFNHMAAQLKQMMSQQQQFVANASHELRTPLTNIKLRAEALLNGARDEPEVAERFLKQIESEANRLGQLTVNLLALSRTDSGPAVLHTEPVEVETILAERLETFGPAAEIRQVELGLACAPELPLLAANPDQLRLVIDNLLENALKYTPAGGRVSVSAAPEGSELAISISDTGRGIPAEDLPHIFERFYRVNKARTRSADPGGAGLGLSIVQAIVAAHRGRIEVSSNPGQGTTFILRFPLTAASRPPAG